VALVFTSFAPPVDAAVVNTALDAANRTVIP
jgi:hypothetical protein